MKRLVLIANDQEWEARSLETILPPERYVVVRARTGREACERALTLAPDALVLDAQLPDFHGLEVLAELRASPEWAVHTPVILTTAGAAGRQERLDALRAGVWEFLRQPIDGEAFLLQLETFIASKVQADQWREGNFLDPVTGLYNARGFARRAHELAATAARAARPLSCAVLTVEAAVPAVPAVSAALSSPDPDHLILADQLGHLLRTRGRADDCLGRLGATEFAVVATTGADGVGRLIERLRDAGSLLPMALDGAPGLRIRAAWVTAADLRAIDLDVGQLVSRASAALGALLASGEQAPWRGETLG